ncbi:MAG TPA: hypothetical protein VGW38_28305 [Chloroflexota bacterium]|nr:hypothetical protein [Chloroflexota bacterium]
MERSSRWRRVATRLARIGWLVLLVSVALMVLGSAVVAVLNPDTEAPTAESTECDDPPCFGGGGLPGLVDLPTVVSFVGYSVAILLGVPSAVVGLWSVLRGQWRLGVAWLLTFVGPVLFIVGTELVPHVVNPCFAAEVAGEKLPSYCERTESGADISGRVHALHHGLVGAVPMAVLYTWALRRWRPDVV